MQIPKTPLFASLCWLENTILSFLNPSKFRPDIGGCKVIFIYHIETRIKRVIRSERAYKSRSSNPFSRHLATAGYFADCEAELDDVHQRNLYP
jgi:hypothetical protein